MWIARPVVTVVIAALVLAACGQGGPSASGANDGTPATIALRTLTPEPPGTPQACMAALITSTLVRDATSGVALRDEQGLVRKVIWRYGYAARDDGGRLAILDASGLVIAHEGDRVSIGGGETGTDGTWNGCGETTILP